MKIWVNGKFYDEGDPVIKSVDQGFLYGNGVYETLCTYNKIPFKLEEHLKRLSKSAKLIGLRMGISKRELGKKILETIQINKEEAEEFRLRVTITHGTSNFSSEQISNTVCIQIMKLEKTDKRIYEVGVKVITHAIERIIPAAKSCNMIPNIIAKRHADKKHAYEALLIDNNGNVTEGAITNLFITKNQKIITPKKNILLGVTRSIVIKLAKSHYKILEKNLEIDDILSCDEMFLTNTTKEIIPVKTINEIELLNVPGPITTDLMQKFKDYVGKQ